MRSHKGNPVGYDRPPKGSPKGGKDRPPKGEGKGKEVRCRRCGKPGHVEKDCWSKSPKRTDKDKGKGKSSEKGGKPKGGEDRSQSPYGKKRKGSPKGGKPKGGKGDPKGGKGPKGGKPKGAHANVGEEDRENLAKAKRVSLQPASAPVSPITAPGDVPIPGTPPEAFQGPISEEEASYRKELSERLAKLSDEVPESEKKSPKK